jgi:ribonuclease T2
MKRVQRRVVFSSRASTRSRAHDAYQLDGFDRSERFASLLVDSSSFVRAHRRRWRHLRHKKRKKKRITRQRLFSFRFTLTASRRIQLFRSSAARKADGEQSNNHPRRIFFRLAARIHRVSRSYRHESLVAIALRVARRRGAHDDRSTSVSGVDSRRSFGLTRKDKVWFDATPRRDATMAPETDAGVKTPARRLSSRRRRRATELAVAALAATCWLRFETVDARRLLDDVESACARAGERTHDGCEDGVRVKQTAFDMWELARSWTPGFCATTRCKQRECDAHALAPRLTLHGLWPSYATPVGVGGSRSRGGDKGGCYWPQNCAKPAWYPEDEAWRFDARALPDDAEFERVAPAWSLDGLGEHEWGKHGTCAAWVDTQGQQRGMTQREFYNATFALAERLGTPDALARASGSDVNLRELQDAFGGPSKVALGCSRSCELVQVVQCFKRTADGGIGDAEDCPCVGVRDSRYDNSCEHSCARVSILSPSQTRCHRPTLTVAGGR